jgi:hypothetical protein
MRCSKCSVDNREGRKFCAPLAVTCPKCGASNQPDEKFCGDCGTPLQVSVAITVPEAPAVVNDGAEALVPASHLPEGERKTITALFADIKGFYLRDTYQRWKIGPEIASGGESMFRFTDASCEMQLILLLSLTHANTLQSKS